MDELDEIYTNFKTKLYTSWLIFLIIVTCKEIIHQPFNLFVDAEDLERKREREIQLQRR